MESKLIPMLAVMHGSGVRVDIDAGEQLYHKLSERQNMLMGQIKQASGFDIEPWNAGSLARVFDSLGLHYELTEKTRAPSFTKASLAHETHPVAKRIRDVRHLDRLKETFVKGVVLEGNHKGRIHCQFNQLKSDEGGTVTGRFSSSNPNLQQIPVRGEDGKLIRQIFLPEQEHWHKLDYSQVEFRLLVNDAFELDRRGLCQCPGASELVEEFNVNPKADYHQITADRTGFDRDSVAKTINFGLAFGEGIDALCRNLGVSREKGEEIIREYHERMPFMRPLMKYYKDKARNTREVRTLYGRQRHFNRWGTPDGRIIVSDKRPPHCELAYTYTALNARIQGSAADIMKHAMVKVWESGVCDVIGAPLLTVHDELDLSAPSTIAGRDAVAEIKHIMEHTAALSLPLRVDARRGPNWGSCE